MLENDELAAFIAAARSLNFARAAKDLRVSPPQISKLLGTLEKKLQKKLFVRTTRNVRITPDGERLLPLAKKALQANRDAEEVFLDSSDNSVVTGTIRCTCANTLAIRCLSQATQSFLSLYPKVTFDIVQTDSYLNLHEDDIDIAIRIMSLHESSLMSRKLADNPVVFCASPSYLKNNKAPRRIEELHNHPVHYIPQHAGLLFRKAKMPLNMLTNRSQVTAGNGDFLIEFAKRGGGIIARSAWGVAREIREGSLILLDLNDSLVSTTSIYAVYTRNRYMPQRLKLWIEHLIEAFKEVNNVK